MSVFHFKYFSIQQTTTSLKVGTDAMLLGASIYRNSYNTVLDIGTGTGVLSLMCKQNNLSSKIIAIDIDSNAIKDCMENFKNSNWNNDLTASIQDFETFIPNQLFDCIICNPPFYENGLLSKDNAINRSKHSVEFSIESLFFKAKQWLSKEGNFWVILPHSTSHHWITHAKQIGLNLIEKTIIYSKGNTPIREILMFSKEKSEKLIEKSLIIRNNDNTYSNEYKKLTIDFHNKKL